MGTIVVRRRAVVIPLAIALAAAAALVPAASAGVVDETWSCPVFQEGEAHQVGFVAQVATPTHPAYMQFFPTPIAFDEPAVLPGLDVQTSPASVTWNPRNACTRARVALALGPHGLPKESVVSTRFVGRQDATCKSETQILFRARVTLRGRRPTRAQVIAVDTRSHKPLGYLEWTPQRVVSWLDRQCDASP